MACNQKAAFKTNNGLYECPQPRKFVMPFDLASAPDTCVGSFGCQVLVGFLLCVEVIIASFIFAEL